jgi:hypothetical protein
MIWKQLGNSLTTAHVLAEISRGWLKNGVQRLLGYGYLQNTIYRNTFCTIFPKQIYLVYFTADTWLLLCNIATDFTLHRDKLVSFQPYIVIAKLHKNISSESYNIS